MMWFSNLKIGTRLRLGFALMLAMVAAVAGLGLASMGRVDARIAQIVDDHNVKIFSAGVMGENFRNVLLATASIVLVTDPGDVKDQVGKLAVARARYGAAKKTLLATQLNESDKRLLAKLDQAIAFSRPKIDQAVALGIAGARDAATGYMLKESIPSALVAIGVIDEIVEFEKQQARDAADDAKAQYHHANLLLLSIGVLAMLAGGAVAWITTRSIVGPIRAAVVLAEKVAGGDLSSVIKVESGDETGQLMAALRHMNESLRQVVGEVRGGTDAITAASSEIAGGNRDLSSRTEQQAGSLAATASSMEELTSTVKQNADHARQANRLAISASAVAIKGGAVVSQVVDTMGSIHGSARKVVDIIAVIDGIAFQTNILALNAAVEAARAGEQGRGFAVVATEVRNLAQRSAAAAREIKTLIGESVEEVDAGIALVNQASSTMQAVVESIKSVTDIMDDITAASQKQAAGIEQVNHAISQIDSVTQQNAALVEEAAAAAQALQDQAGSLSQVVSVFKLDATTAAPGTPANRAGPVLPVAVRRAQSQRHISYAGSASQ
ncbi:MAG: methyl-accepting chemotaxis protein [Pseudomonadota bacterium]